MQIYKDPAATQPERKTSEMFLRVVTLCTKKNHKKRPHMDKVICCPCKCCHLSLPFFHLTGYFGVSDNLPIQLYSFSLQPFHILFMIFCTLLILKVKDCSQTTVTPPEGCDSQSN